MEDDIRMKNYANIFFIVGCGRSGTSLVKTLINSQNKVFIPNETFFYSSVAPKIRSLTMEVSIEKLPEFWWLKDMSLNLELIKNIYNKHDLPNSVDRVFISLLESLNIQNKEYIGEKTPTHFRVAKQLVNAFHGCKIIHVIRDPRAVLCSSKGQSVGSHTASGVISQWSEAIQVHKQLVGLDNYMFLTYESLVRDPNHELEAAMRFISSGQEGYLPMDHTLTSNENQYSPEQVQHLNTRKPIFVSSIFKWKEELRPSEVKLIESFCGEDMVTFGYERSFSAPLTKPVIKYYWSVVCERIHRVVFRSVRQRVKKYKALKRINNKF